MSVAGHGPSVGPVVRPAHHTHQWSYLAPQLCDASAPAGLRHQGGARTPGPHRCADDDDLYWTAWAAAEPILRIATFTVAAPDKQQVFQLFEDVHDLFVAVKGCRWVTLSYDPATGQNVGVSLWDSQADMEALVKTDAFNTMLGKLAPLLKGDYAAKIYLHSAIVRPQGRQPVVRAGVAEPS